MGLFGIGDGKMEMQIANVNVAPGETVEGAATLTLNKDVKGKEVLATLFAERTEIRYYNGKRNSSRVRMYAKSETLDTEKLYTKQDSPYQYKFSFVIPLLQTPQTSAAPSGALGAALEVVGVLNTISGNSVEYSPACWYVMVELKHEAMLTFSISKMTEINVAAPPQPGGGAITN